MQKTYDKIQKGDIFKTEYGDYGNWVEIIFDHNEIEYYESGKAKTLKTVGKYRDGREFVGYSSIYFDKIPKYNVICEVNNTIATNDKEEN